MSSYDVLQNNFPFGELSPLWKGRSNTELYRMGLDTCKNFMPMTSAGLRRRPGTKFVTNTQDSKDALIIPCVLSGITNVVVEITQGDSNGTARVWFADSPLSIAGSLSDVKLKFAGLLDDVRYSINNNVIWFVSSSMRPVTLALAVSGNTITLTVAQPNFTGDVNFATADMYPSVVGFKGGRLFFGGTAKYPNGIFASRSPDYTQVNPERYTDFTFADTGMKYELTEDETVVSGKTYYRKNSSGTYTVVTPVGSENPVTEGWYEYVEKRTVDSSHALEIEDNELGKALWFCNSKRFLVGSKSIIFSDEGNVVSPTTFDVSPTIREGSSVLQAKGLKNFVIYAGPSNKTLNVMVYDYDNAQYVSYCLTNNSGHLFSSGIKDFAICFMPESVIWVVLNDGTFLSCSFERTGQGIYTGWARHCFNDTSRKVIRIASVPQANGKDSLYMLVDVVNGANHSYHIEALSMDDIFSQSDSAFYLDMHQSYSVAQATNVFMFDSRFAGQTVSVVSDGSILPDCTVEDGTRLIPGSASYYPAGSVVLDRTVTNCCIGFNFESLAGFLSQEQPTNGQSSFGNKRRLKRTTLRVYKSFGGYIGQYTDKNKMCKLLTERYGDLKYGVPVSLVDEDIVSDIQGSNLTSAVLNILTDIPMPLNILALKEKIELLET